MSKIAIIYYSMFGSNYKLANLAYEAAKSEGSQARILKVQELASQDIINSVEAWKANEDATKHIAIASLEDLEWADSIIFLLPTRFGGIPSQIKQFIDISGPLWSQGKLANKVVSAMVTAQSSHGGQEATILSLYTSMYHWGAIIAAPGYTDPHLFASGGNPYGTSVTINQDGSFAEGEENIKKAVEIQVKRNIDIAKKIWG